MFDPSLIEKILEETESLRASHRKNELVRIDALLRDMMVGISPATKSGNPLQRPGQLYFPGLAAQPWPNVRQAVLRRLEEAYPVVKEELMALLEGRVKNFRHYRDDGDWTAEGGTWAAFFLMLHGEPVPESAACPQTVELIRSIPEAADMAMFSALNPKAHIPPHTGPWNTRLTVHLGLVVPEGCRFRVGGETRPWQEGKAFVFDDSFEHEAWNDGDFTRFILLMDVWHPELTEVEIEFLKRGARLVVEHEQNSGKPSAQARAGDLDAEWWVDAARER